MRLPSCYEPRPNRVVVEAYPRLVAQRFFPDKFTFKRNLDSLAMLSQSVKKSKLIDEEKEQVIVQAAALRIRLRTRHNAPRGLQPSDTRS